MSLLSDIVTEAKNIRTQRITLKEGKRPSFFTIKGAIEAKKFKPLTSDEMDYMFTSIFSQSGGLLRHQRHARKFKILELGEMNCIGLTDLRQINIYLESGKALYNLDYEQFFPKSNLGEQDKDQEEQDGDGLPPPEEDDNANSGRPTKTLIDAMISFGDEPTASKAEASKADVTKTQAAPALPTPAAQPAEQKASPADSNTNDMRLDIPALNGNTETSAATEEKAAESANTPQLSVVPEIQDKAATPLAVENTPPQSATPAAVDLDNLLQDQGQAADPPPEATGVHTSMNKINDQLDSVVEESSALGVAVANATNNLAAAKVQEDNKSDVFNRIATGSGLKSGGEQAIDKLLKEMLAKRASDLHLSCDHPVMMRIDGYMEKVNEKEKITPEDLQNWLTPIMPAADAAKLEQQGDADFTYEVKDIGRFRVNVFRDLHGIAAALRHVPAVLKTLEQLDAPEVVKKFCYLSKGLVIINGPAGSGRSTTMTAIINVINNTRKAHLLTIEDPIEFAHTQKNSLIRQREIGNHTISMQEGLRAALREDPDIICTAEIKDAAAMLMAMKCAEAGRLVFSMMHTRTSMSAIDSIINQFTPAHQQQARQLLANTLRGVICQTLVRKKSGGRVAAWEVLIVGDEAASMIRQGRTQQLTAHMIAHRVKGNILLNDSLLKLINEDTVTVNNAINAAADKRALHALAHRRGLKLSA